MTIMLMSRYVKQGACFRRDWRFFIRNSILRAALLYVRYQLSVTPSSYFIAFDFHCTEYCIVNSCGLLFWCGILLLKVAL